MRRQFRRMRRAVDGFSGWQMLAIAGFAIFCSGAAQTYGISPLVDPMLEDLGWSRSLFTSLYAIATLVSAGAVVLVGRQIDRWGNRIIMSLSALVLGAALILLSVTGHVVVLLLGFSLLRASGSGVLTLAARTLVPYWFHVKVGFAFSMIGIANSLSQAIVPLFNERMVAFFGWRATWQINAAVILLVLLPLVAIKVRDRPEDIGQHPDGIARPEMSERTTPSSETGSTARDAIRMPAFWGLVGASAVPSLVVTGLTFHQIAILAERGISTSLAATTFTVEAAVALLTALLAGWLSDRFPVRYVLAGGLVCLAVAMVFLMLTDAPYLAFLYAAFRGISVGVWMVAADVAWPVYFGRRHLGSIRGYGFAVAVVGAAVGPLPLSIAFDLTGEYNVGIMALLILPVVATIAVLASRPPPPARASSA